MYSIFLDAGDASAAATEVAKRHSSILQAAIGLAGVVTGYYFGRIPAEKGAQAAQQAASTAQTALVGAAGSAATSAATAAQANAVAAGANMYEFGRFEIADGFFGVGLLNAGISG